MSGFLSARNFQKNFDIGGKHNVVMELVISRYCDYCRSSRVRWNRRCGSGNREDSLLRISSCISHFSHSRPPSFRVIEFWGKRFRHQPSIGEARRRKRPIDQQELFRYFEGTQIFRG